MSTCINTASFEDLPSHFSSSVFIFILNNQSIFKLAFTQMKTLWLSVTAVSNYSLILRITYFIHLVQIIASISTINFPSHSFRNIKTPVAQREAVFQKAIVRVSLMRVIILT